MLVHTEYIESTIKSLRCLGAFISRLVRLSVTGLSLSLSTGTPHSWSSSGINGSSLTWYGRSSDDDNRYCTPSSLSIRKEPPVPGGTSSTVNTSLLKRSWILFRPSGWLRRRTRSPGSRRTPMPWASGVLMHRFCLARWWIWFNLWTWFSRYSSAVVGPYFSDDGGTQYRGGVSDRDHKAWCRGTRRWWSGWRHYTKIQVLISGVASVSFLLVWVFWADCPSSC